MQATRTKTQSRALDEANGVVASLADLITDLTEQLAEARGRSGDLEAEADRLGSELARDHEIASSPYTSNPDAAKAVARFHEVKARREALDEPRREAASHVIGLLRRLEFLRSGRQEWHRRADEIEAGAVVPDPAPADPDVSPGLDDLPVELQPASSGPDGRRPTTSSSRGVGGDGNRRGRRQRARGDAHQHARPAGGPGGAAARPGRGHRRRGRASGEIRERLAVSESAAGAALRATAAHSRRTSRRAGRLHGRQADQRTARPTRPKAALETPWRGTGRSKRKRARCLPTSPVSGANDGTQGG